MWIARDKDGTLCVYGVEPEHYETTFGVDDDNWTALYPDEFPEVTWENSPIEIKSLREVKK